MQHRAGLVSIECVPKHNSCISNKISFCFEGCILVRANLGIVLLMIVVEYLYTMETVGCAMVAMGMVGVPCNAAQGASNPHPICT